MKMSSRAYANLSRLTNLRVNVDKSGSVAHVALPGLSLDQFDRTKKLSAIKLQQLLTSTRIYAYHTPNETTGRSFLQYDEITKDCFTFMASSATEVCHDYYQIPAMSNIPNLSVKINLGFVGTSSLNSIASLVDSETEKEYARNINQVVTVDKATRKPTPLPDWWMQRYKDSVIGGEKLICPRLTVPTDKNHCHEYNMMVPWSDIDAQKHTTYTAYIRYCYDAAMDSVSKGIPSKLKDDILNYCTKKFNVLFIGESNAGEQLNVKVWENADNPYILHFDISREGQSIFQNTIEFYRLE